MWSPLGSDASVADAVDCRRVCFSRRSFNSAAERPGNALPRGNIRIATSAFDDGVLNIMGDGTTVGVEAEGSFAVALDLNPLLVDIFALQSSCKVFEIAITELTWLARQRATQPRLWHYLLL